MCAIISVDFLLITVST